MTDASQYEHRDEGHDGSHYQPDAGPMDLAAVHAIPMDWLGWKTFPDHGDYRKYVQGCRCTDCRAANADYKRLLRSRKVG